MTWETSQGETQGTAKRMVREPMDVSGHHEAASEENPEVLVRSYKSGKKAVHKPAALRRR